MRLVVFDYFRVQNITSGVLIDDARGNYVSDKIYSDLNIHQLESFLPTQPHREIDIAITDASEEGAI